MPITHDQLSHKDRKRAMPKNQLKSSNHVVSIFAGNYQCQFVMVAYNGIFFYISYSLCLTFRLCSSMIVFYTSLEVIKLAFLQNKRRYVGCILANFIFTFERKKLINVWKKNRVNIFFIDQSVTWKYI